MINKLVSVIVAFIILIGTAHISLAADPSTNSSTITETKALITKIAIEHGIPPEIMKAIAFVETGDHQYNADGTPFISADGGIGIMQITPANITIPVDIEKLKTNMTYNIEIAAQVLDKKWDVNYLPKVNQHNKTILEDWYFVIMAYNGLSKSNDPNLNPGNTYQEKIYQRIEGSSLILSDQQHYFIFPKFDIHYVDGNNNMFFPPDVNYQTTAQTPSHQMYSKDDIVYINGKDGAVRLHDGSIDGPVNTTLWPYTPLTIESGPIESSPSNGSNNDYVFYKVKGVNVEGYVASAYLNMGNQSILFSDPIDDQRSAALAFMSLHHYAHGYSNGAFGSSDLLKREHVAVILDNILHLTMPSDYKMKADDVKSTNSYYEQLKKVEYNHYLGGGGKLRPNESLTRAQMAKVLSLAFGKYYQQPTSVHQFQDPAHKLWDLDAINTIYFNHVSVADPFHPSESITRSQFALFIYRTMVTL